MATPRKPAVAKATTTTEPAAAVPKVDVDTASASAQIAEVTAQLDDLAQVDRVAMVSRRADGTPDQGPGYEVLVPDDELAAARNEQPSGA